MRVIDEINADSPTLTQDLVHKGAVQILTLMEEILKDTQKELPQHNGERFIPISLVYEMISELKKKKPQIVVAENMEEARKKMESQ